MDYNKLKEAEKALKNKELLSVEDTAKVFENKIENMLQKMEKALQILKKGLPILFVLCSNLAYGQILEVYSVKDMDLDPISTVDSNVVRLNRSTAGTYLIELNQEKYVSKIEVDRINNISIYSYIYGVKVFYPKIGEQTFAIDGNINHIFLQTSDDITEVYLLFE